MEIIRVGWPINFAHRFSTLYHLKIHVAKKRRRRHIMNTCLMSFILNNRNWLSFYEGQSHFNSGFKQNFQNYFNNLLSPEWALIYQLQQNLILSIAFFTKIHEELRSNLHFWNDYELLKSPDKCSLNCAYDCDLWPKQWCFF